ncbi:unnamed protein product [Neospora caninum Liverpool]|uniref:Protein kinase domain-containing protein n=1 Tax=Neospora caninum (strain Liverpool) TaxID=572307 RepID=F0V776_NEOCL|nr:uncharacterized protein NCLIV_000650 [Neospora caninum Liverpool]CBZ49567.1 unnamed protein product [Neospora caninum Liverpool]|eukprot:XP_003879602.1 uncharacterized protein NCLIV_000650 [Neospora caninum Liverpool]
MCAFLSILAVLSVAGLRPRANFSLAANAEPPSAEERFPSTFHDSASADHQGAAEELQSTSERLAPDVHPLTGTQHRRLDSLVPGFLKRMQIFKRLRPVDDSKFNEFKKAGSRVTATFFSASHSEVTLIYKPSSALLDFLGFAREDVPYGLVIKAIPYEAVDLYSVVSEPYIHRMFDDKNKFPYVLPLLAALRSTTRRVVYLVLPLYRMLPNTVEEQAATVDFVLLLAELAMAARQLHERNLTHRDLKDDNFLVAPDGHIVVADMATVEFADEKSYLVGTTDFMPPETTSTYFLRHGFTRTRYDDTTDVYSLGVTFRRLGLMLMDQKVRIPNRKRLTTLVKKMTNLDPKARPNISQVMDDPYFEGIDFAVVRQRTGPAPFSKLPGADEAMKRIRAKIRQRQEEEDKFVNGEEGGRGKGKEKNAAKRKAPAKLGGADGQILSWNENIQPVTPTERPITTPRPVTEAVSDGSPGPSQIPEEARDVLGQEPDIGGAWNAARDSFLYPGQSADLSFATGPLSYLECEEAINLARFSSASVPPSTFTPSSGTPSPPSASFHAPDSRGILLPSLVVTPQLACSAKLEPAVDAEEPLLRSVASCSALFAALRAADWRHVEEYNMKVESLGVPQSFAPLAHAVPTGLDNPLTIRSGLIYWAKACLYSGIGDVCVATVWCTDGIRIVSRLGSDTTGDIFLRIGERVALLKGVTGVYSQCLVGTLCQKAKFVGKVEETSFRDTRGSRTARSTLRQSYPYASRPLENTRHNEQGAAKDRAAQKSDDVSRRGVQENAVTIKIQGSAHEPQQMPIIPLWSLDCTREFLALNDVAAVYTIKGESFVKMGWTTDRKVTVYCHTSETAPNFSIHVPLVIVVLVQIAVAAFRHIHEASVDCCRGGGETV